MFDDINLLPEDLRSREKKEQEKIEKGSGFSNGELSYPSQRTKRGNGFDYKGIEKKDKDIQWEVKDEKQRKEKKESFFSKIKKIFKRKKVKQDKESKPDLKKDIIIEEKHQEKTIRFEEELLEPKIIEEFKSEEPPVKKEKKLSLLVRLRNFFKKKEIPKKEEIKPILPIPKEEEKIPVIEKRDELVIPDKKLEKQEDTIDLKSAFQENQAVDWAAKEAKEKKEEIIPLEKTEKKKAHSRPSSGPKVKFNLAKFFGFLKRKPKDKSPEAVVKKKKKLKPVQGLSSGDNLNAPSDSLEVNLVPASRDYLPLPKIISYFILTIIINLMVIGVLYGGVILYNYQVQLKSEIQDQRIAEKIEQIEELEDREQEAENLLKEVEQVENILNKHVYWTKFFSTLESYTLDNVYYTNFAATSAGDITLAAVTSDYLSVAKQLIALEDSEDFIKKVEIASAAKTLATEETPAQVSFNISLTLDPQVFLIPLDND